MPGQERSIPLYLLAPGAYRGPRLVVVKAAMIFGSMVATSVTAWAVTVEALAGTDGHVAGDLTVVAVVLWACTGPISYRAWLRRPRTRPFNNDLSRW